MWLHDFVCVCVYIYVLNTLLSGRNDFQIWYSSHDDDTVVGDEAPEWHMQSWKCY